MPVSFQNLVECKKLAMNVINEVRRLCFESALLQVLFLEGDILLKNVLLKEEFTFQVMSASYSKSWPRL